MAEFQDLTEKVATLGYELLKRVVHKRGKRKNNDAYVLRKGNVSMEFTSLKKVRQYIEQSGEAPNVIVNSLPEGTRSGTFRKSPESGGRVTDVIDSNPRVKLGDTRKGLKKRNSRGVQFHRGVTPKTFSSISQTPIVGKSESLSKKEDLKQGAEQLVVQMIQHEAKLISDKKDADEKLRLSNSFEKSVNTGDGAFKVEDEPVNKKEEDSDKPILWITLLSRRSVALIPQIYDFDGKIWTGRLERTWVFDATGDKQGFDDIQVSRGKAGQYLAVTPSQFLFYHRLFESFAGAEMCKYVNGRVGIYPNSKLMDMVAKAKE
jgi:hypothetical protein